MIAVLASGGTVGKAAPSDERTIVHVLNRIGFGPRPGSGDIEKVRAMGIERYIEQQLQPDRIPDPGTDARLAHLSTVRLSAAEIHAQYEQPILEARRAERDRAMAGSNGNETAPGAATTPPAMRRPQQAANAVVLELSEQKLLRAIYGERQLQEVLADFWFNHFNVDARKNRVRFLITEYERDAIRPHVLGRFRSLLGAVAKSPAMLVYLDNFMSVDPEAASTAGARPSGARRRPGGFAAPRPQNPAGVQARMPRGLNENYARELMELHTLGVDGGYSQKDVVEVARAFTGWTLENPRQGGGFRFNSRLHDDREKTVLGHRIKAGGGIEDGEQVLDILARHPATARFVATKLARRFVSDEPPQALVERATARFVATGGDLREVTRTLLLSPEFLAADAYRTKVKTPFEFLVSSIRAVNAQVEVARGLVRTMQELGMPLYQCQPPTGYKDTADAWTNTGALVSRMNVAQSLGANRLAGVRVETASDLGEDVAAALGHDISVTTRATIGKAGTVPERLALALGSPEFQRR
jgi:uncharacterized protein (DUF1800 family)